MKSAVDSSVIFSILRGESTAEFWMDILVKHAKAGELVICDIVASEISVAFDDFSELKTCLKKLNIRLDPLTLESTFIASKIFRAYRNNGGPRDRIIPDFIIGAHGLNQCDLLIAADRGFYREYFEGLTLIGAGAQDK